MNSLAQMWLLVRCGLSQWSSKRSVQDNPLGCRKIQNLYSKLFLGCSLKCSTLACLFFFFLAALGLRCCAQGFSSCGEQGLLFIAVCRLLIAVASLVGEHGL